MQGLRLRAAQTGVCHPLLWSTLPDPNLETHSPNLSLPDPGSAQKPEFMTYFQLLKREKEIMHALIHNKLYRYMCVCVCVYIYIYTHIYRYIYNYYYFLILPGIICPLSMVA